MSRESQGVDGKGFGLTERLPGDTDAGVVLTEAAGLRRREEDREA
jgi:hypothetical protein